MKNVLKINNPVSIFLFILIMGSSLLFIPVTSAQQANYNYRTQVFTKPYYRGLRLDWCYKPYRQCGRLAAHVWCRKNGFDYAAGHAVDYNIGQSRIIGTKQMCRGSSCTGYRWVRCNRRSR